MGLSKSVPADVKRPICDFCSSEPGVFRYPATTFIAEGLSTADYAQQSIGDWAACATCHAMIEGAEMASLTIRSLNFLCQKEPTYEPFREELYQEMFMLFRQFRQHRCGEPTPLRFEAVHPAPRRVRHVQQQLPKTTKRRPLSQRSTPGGGTMRERFTDFCVYTIKHSDDLVQGRSGTFHEKRAWVTGKRLLEEAKRAKQVLPVVFCPAEGTKYLYAWAVLRKIDITEDGTNYTFEKLRLFRNPPPLKTTMKRKSDRKPLHRNFIRPYAICVTPAFLK